MLTHGHLPHQPTGLDRTGHRRFGFVVAVAQVDPGALIVVDEGRIGEQDLGRKGPEPFNCSRRAFIDCEVQQHCENRSTVGVAKDCPANYMCCDPAVTDPVDDSLLHVIPRCRQTLDQVRLRLIAAGGLKPIAARLPFAHHVESVRFALARMLQSLQVSAVER